MTLQQDARRDRELGHAATCPSTDKASRISVWVNCSGKKKRFRCWIPENCQVRPKWKIIIHVEPHETKSFRIKKMTVRPTSRTWEEDLDLEDLTPLRFVFKCKSTLGTRVRAREHQQDSPVHEIGCETVIKTTNLSVIINHEYRKKRKGGGLLTVYLRRRGGKIKVIRVDEKYLPNLELEE